MNKNFDLQRLGIIMRWDFRSYWVGYLGATIGNIIAFSLYSLFRLHNINPLNGDVTSIKELYLAREATFFTAVIVISFYVMASCIFLNMNTKTSRESYLMIPASNAEKFVARFLQMLIANLLLLVSVLIGTDIIQLAASFILSPGFHASISLSMPRIITHEIWHASCPEANYIAICLLIFLHSFATLGGTFYRKMAQLLTLVTAIVLFMVLGYITNWLDNAGLLDFHINNNIACTITCVFFLALAAFNYWASYKIFTRMQVICNKWINI